MMTPDELRERRNALGLSRDELAPLLGATTRAVRSWEAGERTIPESVGIILSLRQQIGRLSAELDYAETSRQGWKARAQETETAAEATDSRAGAEPATGASANPGKSEAPATHDQ